MWKIRIEIPVRPTVMHCSHYADFHETQLLSNILWRCPEPNLIQIRRKM